MSHDARHHDCMAYSTALPTGAGGIDHAAARARGFHRFEVGRLRITAVFDGSTRLPFHKLMTGATPAEIKRTLAASGNPSPADTPVNAYVIDTGVQRILIDAGAGRNFGGDCGKLIAHLAAAGYAPDDIDIVLLTHMHPDHVGGLVHSRLFHKNEIVFRNAQLFVNQADLDYWFDDALEAHATGERKKIFRQSKAGVEPYIEGHKVVSFTAGELAPGITAIPAPGHTAGHALLRVENAGESIVFFGDLAHSAAVQMPDPSIAITLDSDQVQATASRMEWFARFARERTFVAGAHMTFPGIGHIGARDTGFEWLPY